VTVAGLRERLAQGSPITVVDVRSTAQFSAGHIPGAINIPASLCALKHLPPLGKVVVYDAGLGLSQPDGAAAALAAKPGITVEILEGGFAAWESAQALTTRGRGMKAEVVNYISYADLKAAKADEVLLVDLRELPVANSHSQGTQAGVPSVQPLTDLALEFPGLRQSHSPFQSESVSRVAGVGSSAPLLLVLIDNGDGKARNMSQILKAQGVKRYAILAGGELILARHGQSGLERNSPGSRLLKAASTPGRTDR
jgi:rhodanese-related sulfurtransferase